LAGENNVTASRKIEERKKKPLFEGDTSLASGQKHIARYICNMVLYPF
jgi:hypothetical protein